jgi:hypothetical protein
MRFNSPGRGSLATIATGAGAGTGGATGAGGGVTIGAAVVGNKVATAAGSACGFFSPNAGSATSAATGIR